ncbi:MAG TPA: NCS2 family permease [Candidatus Limnocylindrales bacterium]|nr:NCS2 family permease [Candidatus Limnocylindrales bacterium]
MTAEAQPSTAPPPAPSTGGLAGFFKFEERGTSIATEARAGLTTFFVMVYIIFVNAAILGAGFKLDPAGIAAVSAGTALIAGIMTIAMGVVGNYPLAIAAGLGINGIVAFSLTARGLTPQGAMGVIVLEGLVVTLLVVVGFREAVMNAVPLALKRAIGAGIGLFILFIGFVNGGFIATPVGGVPVVGPVFPTTTAQFLFLAGLLFTMVLWVLKVRGALIISIFVITIVALILGVATIPTGFSATPSFATLGQFDVTNVWTVLGPVAAALTIFAIMLTDFFDTMGTVTGVASEAGLANEDGSVPGVGRVLFIDSIAAIAGGAGGVSSNTTFIESAAGVAEGGRTGFASIVTGVLFLLAIFLSPLASIIPNAATAPALVLVGYLMFTQVKDIDVSNPEDGIPALLTMILMPLTYDITIGIGAGFITWVVIKLARGKVAEIHPLMWVVSAMFVVYFLQAWLNTLIATPAS